MEGLHTERVEYSECFVFDVLLFIISKIHAVNSRQVIFSHLWFRQSPNRISKVLECHNSGWAPNWKRQCTCTHPSSIINTFNVQISRRGHWTLGNMQIWRMFSEVIEIFSKLAVTHVLISSNAAVTPPSPKWPKMCRVAVYTWPLSFKSSPRVSLPHLSRYIAAMACWFSFLTCSKIYLFI